MKPYYLSNSFSTPYKILTNEENEDETLVPR